MLLLLITLFYQPKSSDTITVLLTELADAINGGIVAKAEVINEGSALRVYKDEGDIIARTNPMVVTATTFLTFTKITTIHVVVEEVAQPCISWNTYRN